MKKYKDEPVYQHDFAETTSVNDFMLKDTGNPPEGYPVKKVADHYSKTSFESNFDKRREVFIKHVLKNPAQQNLKSHYYELIRLYKEKEPVYEKLIDSTLNYINNRLDCSDFVMLGIIRLLYQLKDHKGASKELLKKAKKTVLDFKYWPDEIGIDSMCYWTENHQIMFSVNEYLAGQLYYDKTFSNSKMTGQEKMEKAKKRILKWIELRFKTGFNEWLSNIYFDEDITALVNLIDFCQDPELVRRAEIVLDLMFFDMALNSYYGQFVSTHGRCYTNEKKNSALEATIDTAKLMFGMGIFSNADNMSAVALSMSEKYRMPRVIYEVANDYQREEMINKQRVGINIDEAKKWGLNYKDIDSGMILLSFEAYAHPKTFYLTMKLFDEYRWWENQFFTMFKKMKWLINLLRYTGLHKLVAYYFKKDLTRNTREENNLYTYKTPDYMLSSSQDYKKGYGGDQQHIWQATLDMEAVCFTTHPGSYEDTSCGYWLGSGSLPRVAQIKNLAIIIYKISTKMGIYKTNKLLFTHAWLPKDKFDEVIEQNGWIFARKNEGYLALYSHQPYKWQWEGEEKDKEILADGKENIWICELGRKSIDGDFKAFIDRIAAASIICDNSNIKYSSPSQGNIEFGWNRELKQNGQVIPLKDYARYENPYCLAPFPPDEINITCGKETLKVNLEKGIREYSSLV